MPVLPQPSFDGKQPDLSGPLLNSLLSNGNIVALLPPYIDSVTIFTRRPPPTDAAYPMIMVSPDVAKLNMDGIADLRPRITRDIAVYGQNDSSVNYRTVEAIAFAVFDQFHHEPKSITPPLGWAVVDITAHGPTPAPVDDDMYVGRVVSLDILLAHPT